MLYMVRGLVLFLFGRANSEAVRPRHPCPIIRFCCPILAGEVE